MGAFSKRARQPLRERLDQVYTLFPRLKERRRQKAGTFSGGEQQMLAIGRGLMSDPEVLIIDELSLGLAPVVVQQLVGHAEGAQGRRDDHPAGRAERASGAGAQRLRLCDRRGPAVHRRPLRRRRGDAGDPAGLSGAVKPAQPIRARAGMCGGANRGQSLSSFSDPLRCCVSSAAVPHNAHTLPQYLSKRNLSVFPDRSG